MQSCICKELACVPYRKQYYYVRTFGDKADNLRPADYVLVSISSLYLSANKHQDGWLTDAISIFCSAVSFVTAEHYPIGSGGCCHPCPVSISGPEIVEACFLRPCLRPQDKQTIDPGVPLPLHVGRGMLEDREGCTHRMLGALATRMS